MKQRMEMGDSQLFHVFMILCGRQWSVIPKVYDEDEFDEFMDRLGWYMPLGLSAYHFHAKQRPEFDEIQVLTKCLKLNISLEQLMFGKLQIGMRIKNNISQQEFNVRSRLDNFVVIDYEKPYKKIVYVNGSDTKYITDLKL